MRTLRLTKRAEAPAANDGRARTQEVEVSPLPESSSRPNHGTVRLESLATPLRAVVRDHAESWIRIEAELPWLAVGTVVHAGTAEGVEQTGRVQFFDVDVTSAGSARLLIFASLSRPGLPAAPITLPRRRQRAHARRRSPLLIAALIIAAAVSGYTVRDLLAPITSGLPMTLR
jgi:hypothetical protein